MAHVKEILVHWDAGVRASTIARTLCYSRPTVRKYIYAAQRAQLVQGSRCQSEVLSLRLAQAAMVQVVQQ